MGDFFEYYIGKEILRNCIFKNFLYFLKSENIKLYLIPGNRECLIKQEIEYLKSNFYILDNRIEINIGGRNTLLTHGDEILEQEITHLAFKKTMNFIKYNYLDEKVPSNFKDIIAKLLRKFSSGKNKKYKNTLNINNFYNLSNYHNIIMGHFDKQKEINIEFGTKTTKVYLLGKWTKTQPVLIYTAVGPTNDEKFLWIKL